MKTSSKPEWDFYKSFVDWSYMIQAKLYWKIIRSNMDNDPYFKDFKLSDYRFIVVNKRTLTPLVWVFESTQSLDDFVTKDNKVFRHPLIIGKELSNYLNDRPTVPNGIELVKPNKIEDWI